MADLEPRYHWHVAPPAPIADEAIADARARGLSPWLVRVLSRRGPVTPASLAARFDDPGAGLNDPRLLPDADALLRRVAQAVAAREKVLVFGDFDADGLTGLSILVLALRARGLDAEPYVPSRTEEGHGVSRAAIARAAADGRTLILTADCGSTSLAEIAEARAQGIDTIVTDHHSLPPVLPEAVAVVNPHRADAVYPDDRLSGAGVAFKVAQLLLADRPGGPELALGMADLAAIGSIADVVPLEGENRAITRLGLRLLATGVRPGLRALLGSAGVDPARVDQETVSFTLAPRINALGRVGHAEAAARLLLADDPDEIARLTAEVEAANMLRREQTAEAIAEARARVAADAPGEGVLVLSGPWPVGIIGLVAGRLAEEHGRPAVIVSTAVVPWRASARSAGGFDLAAAFASCGHLLERHGGHPAAAGCHVAPEHFEAFKAALLAMDLEGGTATRRPTLTLDLVARAESVDYVLFRDLAPLEREGDAPPLLGVAGLTVRRARQANGGHTQLTLQKGMDVVDAICFGRTDLAETLRPGDAVDVVARLASRTFQGVETLQLEIRDVAPAGHLAALRRASRGDVEVAA
ncbi:MAG: single-stranded-DNA-specific exonuclease RecJ [Chloroflexota bacterium]